MELERKYGVQTDIYFPLIVAGTNNFAGSGDYTYAAADFKISKDGAAAANPTNSPSAITMGNGAMWKLTLTAIEMQAALIAITVVDAATKAVEDQMILIATYGHASAQHAVDRDDSVRAGMTALPNVAAGGAGGLPTDSVGKTAFNDLDAAGIRTAVGLAAATLDAQLAAIAGYIDTEVAAIAVAIAALNDLDAAGIRAAIGMAAADLDTQLGTLALEATLTAIKGVGWSDENLTTMDALLDALPSAAQNAAAVLASVIETGYTLLQTQRIILSACGGKLSGAGTPSEVIRDVLDTKDRITAAVDAAGNRTAVVLDAT